MKLRLGHRTIKSKLLCTSQRCVDTHSKIFALRRGLRLYGGVVLGKGNHPVAFRLTAAKNSSPHHMIDCIAIGRDERFSLSFNPDECEFYYSDVYNVARPAGPIQTDDDKSVHAMLSCTPLQKSIPGDVIGLIVSFIRKHEYRYPSSDTLATTYVFGTCSNDRIHSIYGRGRADDAALIVEDAM
jgi:hypothetical protein